jgi:hypothetical protein
MAPLPRVGAPSAGTVAPRPPAEGGRRSKDGRFYRGRSPTSIMNRSSLFIQQRFRSLTANAEGGQDIENIINIFACFFSE